MHEVVETDLPVGGIRVLGGDPQRHLLAAAADPDLGQGLQRLRIAVRAVEVEVRAVEGDGLLGPESLDHLHGLVEHAQPLARREELVAVGLVLTLVPARAEPEDEATARHDVDAGRLLREQPGVAVRRAGDELPEADLLRVLRERSERGERLEHVRRLTSRHGLHVVVDPEVVVAEVLREPRHLDRARPRVAGVPTGVLELPTLRRERAEPEGQVEAPSAGRDSLKSHHCTSTIIGSR